MRVFTAAEISLWGPEEAEFAVRQSVPSGWELAVRVEDGLAVSEIRDSQGVVVWFGSNWDLKLLYLDALGWLMIRNHKPLHPAWRPRQRDLPLSVPSYASDEPEPLDLDPDEVAAVYKVRR